MALDPMFFIALGAFLVVLAVLGAIFFGIVRASKSSEEAQISDDIKAEIEDEDIPVVATGRRNAASRMQATRRRRQMAAAAAAQQSASNAVVDSEGSDRESDAGDEDEEERENMALPLNKKDRKREEKRQQQEARVAAQEAREQKTSSYDQRQREKQEKKEAERKAQEEEMRKAEEERIKKEEEEAAQWMGMISVEKEGTGECDDQEESQGLLAQFIDYIKQKKTVPLEQLATEFKLRTTDVIDRVQGLEAMGRLTGVMDERGKYIYISMEEMQAVANYITSKGRVAISELAAKSDTFIDMEVKATVEGSGMQSGIDFESLVEASL